VNNTASLFASLLFAGTMTIQSSSLRADTFAAVGGATSVNLAPSFLSGLKGLGVTPAAIGPSALIPTAGGATAVFPITTGALDNSPVSTELDHAGGLSLTANSVRATLSAFIIDSVSGKLTGLVTCKGKLVGRAALFDLKLTQAPIIEDGTLRIDGVGVTLTSGAASALTGCFGKTVPAIAVGTAKVRGFLGTGL
jgi:hypothetical protein